MILPRSNRRRSAVHYARRADQMAVRTLRKALASPAATDLLSGATNFLKLMSFAAAREVRLGG